MVFVLLLPYRLYLKIIIDSGFEFLFLDPFESESTCDVIVAKSVIGIIHTSKDAKSRLLQLRYYV